MRTLLIPVVASAAVVLAAPAHADTQGFIDYMYNHGGTTTASSTGESYLTYGQQVCQALQSGASESSQIGRLEGLMSRAESGLVVTGAHQFLCPGV
ncbi:MAG: DUF732 domain-containing protein [Mycobacterium sp.]|uniref:DUF732 domain-containing protein n=1 Tax=Mycobacterium sp. TaxID=1785 RepID=UPI003BAE4615